MAPSVTAKSGIVMTLDSSVIRPGADADAEERDADRQAHRQHRAERQDQDDDGEAETDQFRFRRLELAERLATDLDLEPLDVGRLQFGDLGADLAGFGLAEVLREVDLGVGDLSGERTLGGDQAQRRSRGRVGAGRA